MAIRALFGGLRRAAAEPRRESRSGRASVAGVPRYPPFEAGIEASPVRELLREHADLLGRIRVAYGGEEGSCEARLVPVIEAYAAFVHRLPATPDAHFRGEGGLLRLGLEVGFHALQAADGQIFSARRTVPERRALEPRWRTAAFVAGLCVELHRTLAVVVAAEDDEVWCPFTGPLARWLQAGRHERYSVRWVEPGETNRAAGVLVLPHVISPTLMAYLGEGNGAVLPQLMGSLGGVPLREHGALDGIVRRTLGLVIDRDLRTTSPGLRPSAPPPRFEPSLVDVLRRLARSEAWSPNRPGSPVWFGVDGVFLVWPDAARDSLEILGGDGAPALARAPETLAEGLRSIGALRAAASGDLLWQIAPPGSSASLSALRFADPGWLFGADAPQPLPIKLECSGARAVEPVPEPPPAPATAPVEAPPAEPAAARPHVGEAEPAPRQLSLGIAPSAADEEAEEAPQGVLERGREIALPPGLNPIVADALRAILGNAPDALHDEGIEAWPDGVFVPLSAWRRRGLDTGMVVRTLHESRLLVVRGGRKVREGRSGRATEPGVVLSPKVCSVTARTVG